MTGVGLLVLTAAAIAGLLWTRDVEPPAANEGAVDPSAQKKAPRRERLVDMRPLLTARKMAALATAPEEQEFAHQALRLGDHAVDLAFADAMRQAADNPAEPTPQIKELVSAKEKARAAVDADQKRIHQLGQQLAGAQGREKEQLEDQLEVAKAQMELDHDELDESAENLERAGGDPQARIQRLKTAFDAAQKTSPPTPAVATDGSSLQATSLYGRSRAWVGLRDKVSQLAQAKAEALEKGQRMTKWREKLALKVQQAAELRENAKRSAEGFTTGTTDGGDASKVAAKTAVASLKRFTDDQRRLTDIGKRILDQQELGEVYAGWIDVAETQARAALHRVIKGAIWILATLLLVFLAGRLIDRLFLHMGKDQLRIGTLQTVAKLGTELVGLLVILFIVFGVPGEMTTILGLAGAGLTVAMKDFIVAFFGWFILMGRNGIRVGDWVEIEGVGGEVAEIGLLHTVLLETGSWSDSGHPTGRRVSFVNSFAIEGHYFNFSTSGQWMWDELRLMIPNGQDPYPTIDSLQKLLERETEANAKLAEQEWGKNTNRYRVRTFSAVPGINVVPSSGGVEIQARYITRAYERHETRRRLYHAVVELLHGKRPEGQDSSAA